MKNKDSILNLIPYIFNPPERLLARVDILLKQHLLPNISGPRGPTAYLSQFRGLNNLEYRPLPHDGALKMSIREPWLTDHEVD
jgi:hypothetical protein